MMGIFSTEDTSSLLEARSFMNSLGKGSVYWASMVAIFPV
jgi:hypothetical protein